MTDLLEQLPLVSKLERIEAVEVLREIMKDKDIDVESRLNAIALLLNSPLFNVELHQMVKDELEEVERA